MQLQMFRLNIVRPEERFTSALSLFIVSHSFLVEKEVKESRKRFPIKLEGRVGKEIDRKIRLLQKAINSQRGVDVPGPY